MKNLVFEVQKIDVIKENDKSFLKAKFWAISEGSTRNNVAFTLSSIENCIPTVRNKPVLAAYNKKNDEFEGHNDLGLKVDGETGETFFDYDSGIFDGLAQRPIGVIPSESNVKIEEYNGKQWLTFDVLIWTKYSHRAAKTLKKLGQEKISVEVTAIDYSVSDTTEIVVNDFVFDGVTIIGVEEGIEGAHLKIGQFAQSNTFAEFRQALMFAYEGKDNENKESAFNSSGLNDSGKEEDATLKFDLKGMGLNTFNSKINMLLDEYRFKRDDEDWEYRKYWIHDVFVDENVLILEDCENRILIKVPFYVSDDRSVVIEFDKAEEVELSYISTSRDIEIEFKGLVRFEKTDESLEDKSKDGGRKMDIKHLEKFAEKGFSPIGKSGEFVLFVNSEVKDTVYKMEAEVIETTEEKDFEAIIEKMSVLEVVKLTEDSDENEGEDDESKEEVFTKAQFDELNASFELEKEKVVKLEKDLEELSQKCAEFEFEKFKLEAHSFVEGVKGEFNTEQDKFAGLVFDKIDSKEITDKEMLENFVAKQLLEKTLREKTNKSNQFNLNPNKDSVVEDKAKNKLFNLV